MVSTNVWVKCDIISGGYDASGGLITMLILVPR